MLAVGDGLAVRADLKVDAVLADGPEGLLLVGGGLAVDCGDEDTVVAVFAGHADLLVLDQRRAEVLRVGLDGEGLRGAVAVRDVDGQGLAGLLRAAGENRGQRQNDQRQRKDASDLLFHGKILLILFEFASLL